MDVGKQVNGRILLVSDDADANHIWSFVLSQRGLEVVTVQPAGDMLDWLLKDPFDLIIINVYTSLEDALQLCRLLRAEVANPILLFTGVSDESWQLEAYDAGVDECIVKPIGHRLFVAKVGAWLRRAWTVPTETLDHLQVDDLRLDAQRRVLTTVDGLTIKLTNLEFRVLHLLMGNRGQMLETNVIVDRVWGHTGQGDGVLLKNVIYRLRRKIERDPSQPRYLHTLPGVGYTFRRD